MDKIRLYFVISLVVLVLTACQVKTPVQTPTAPVLVSIPASSSTPELPTTTATQTPSPVPPTVTKTPTTAPSHTASPSPTNTATPVWTSTPLVTGDGEGTACLPEDPAVGISTEIFQQPDFEVAISDYLNAGGEPERLLTLLGSEAPNPNLIQALQHDLDNDGFMDVLLTITLYYFDGYGESHVLAYLCSGEQFEPTILFRRAGAGSRAEGLYAGGGARVERLADLNRDGDIEIHFSVNWPGVAEYYILSWIGGELQSLVKYSDILGYARHAFDIQPGGVRVDDVDSDGVYELVVTAIGYQTMIEGTHTWYWDGEKYSLPDE